jgi:hypothetical protein
MGHEFKSNQLKLEPQDWNQNWNPTQANLPVVEFSFEFIFGRFIKINFINKLAPIFVSLFSTSCVLSSGILGWDGCQLINHQLIP